MFLADGRPPRRPPPRRANHPPHPAAGSPRVDGTRCDTRSAAPPALRSVVPSHAAAPQTNYTASRVVPDPDHLDPFHSPALSAPLGSNFRVPFPFEQIAETSPQC